MFRFSMEKGKRYDVSQDQLVTAAITEDDDYGQRLKNSGEYRDGERYFRAENKTPRSAREAVEWVQGIFFHAPSRIWLDEEEVEITDEVIARARKPHA